MLLRAKIICLIVLLFAVPARAEATAGITILSDSTLSFAMSALAREYTREHQVMVGTSFADSEAQQAQIDEGGEADVLITTRTSWIESLKTQGVVDVYSERIIARNRLALASGLSFPVEPRSDGVFPLTELLKAFGWQQAFVVASPDALDEGRFSREALRNLDVSSDLEEYTLYVKSRSLMESMIRDQHMTGIVLSSTLTDAPGFKLIDLLPETSHTPIHYFAVVIAGDNMEEARRFLQFLGTDTAKEILRKHGFFVD
ncbi:MAG: molybdate ABC transporter substrate-binding protein [Alphaproteobacteria bacterium]|nr:molybdate ABC transporter substrate-binding protein [Alphaproteobacteria bacterium]